ncbi:hypothetical protein EES44_27370 [Streptomyces sp. ADI96-15]|uniref:DUF4232 domain-containing protein n=1 Tax=Streptomyces TaxID=1883 RepID=UPI0003C2DAB5|nr:MULTISPECIES: DUF4232 domain-containing protein [unclassified Streptomyces]ESQ04976.1 Hypothetical protein B590_13508 [Streptomyces sp. PVA_94-07]RPK56023.1 hypothetical protein EES44_27370 [Streptomyces sp. ADI96-15]
MRVRPLLALTAAGAALVALAPQAGAATAAGRAPLPLPTCRPSAVAVGAEADARDKTVVRITVTNRGRHTCAVDRLPTVTFGDLDGAAQHLPPGESGPYRLVTGEKAYATVRTVGAPGDEIRRVGGVTVAGDPSHHGWTFSARELGTGRYVEVWEPVSSWWKGSARAADEAVGVGRA